MQYFFTLALLFFYSFAYSQAPNFIFILADDMGWNGTSVQMSATESGSKSDFYETPTLEQLAADGMTFSQAYAPAAKCSPSRCAILNGKTTARNRFTEVNNDGSSTGEILISAPTENSYPTTDVSIAGWLESNTALNYRTAHYGKWHINSGGPSNNGFDEGDGNTSNGDGEAGDGETIQTDPKKITELTNKALQFMEDAHDAGEPFYIHLGSLCCSRTHRNYSGFV